MPESEILDLVQYFPQTFLRYQSTLSSQKDTITVSSLLASYTCFDESVPSNPPMDTRSHGSRRGNPVHHGMYGGHQRRYHPHGSHGSHGSSSGSGGSVYARVAPIRRHRQLGYEEKLRRELQSLLNKMSVQNFERIADKILTLTDKNNFSLVLDTLLQKCYSQDAFIKNYTYILMRLHDLFPDVRAVFEDQLVEFYNAFAKDLQTLCVPDDILTNASEDAYCGFVKTKRYLYGKNRVLLTVMHRLSDFPILEDAYFDRLMDFMTDTCMNDPMYEIAILLIREFSLAFPHAHEKIDRFKRVFHETIEDRVQFKKVLFLLKEFSTPPTKSHEEADGKPEPEPEPQEKHKHKHEARQEGRYHPPYSTAHAARKGQSQRLQSKGLSESTRADTRPLG
jgi:hypothetical protein